MSALSGLGGYVAAQQATITSNNTNPNTLLGNGIANGGYFGAAQQQASMLGHPYSEWVHLLTTMQTLGINSPRELIAMLTEADNPLKDRARALIAEHKLEQISNLLKDLNSTKE